MSDTDDRNGSEEKVRKVFGSFYAPKCAYYKQNFGYRKLLGFCSPISQV